MKKKFYLLIFLLLSQLFTACAQKSYNHGEISNQAILHPVSNGKTMLGIEMMNIIILQVNGEKAGDWWNGVGGDEVVNSGKVNIFVKYTSGSVVSSTTFIFNAIAGKTYDIQGTEVDDMVEFKLLLDGNVLDVKKEKKQLAQPANYTYVPIII